MGNVSIRWLAELLRQKRSETKATCFFDRERINILRQVNRSVVVIKPLQPYVDWCNSMPDIEKTGKYTLEDAQEDCLALLVPTRMFMPGYDRWINKIYKEIFEEMLNAWCTDRGLWPKEASRSMFREWFNVEIHSEVLDTTSKALIHETE